VIISPPLINSAIDLSLPNLKRAAIQSDASMNVNAELFTIGFHCFPVFGDFGLIFRKLAPRHFTASGGKLDISMQLSTGTRYNKDGSPRNPLREPEAGPCFNGIVFAIGAYVVGVRLDECACAETRSIHWCAVSLQARNIDCT